MNPNFLPQDLFKKCHNLVRLTHKTHGVRGLPAEIWNRKYIVELSCMSDTYAALQKATSSFKYQIALLVGTAICVVLSFTLTWWFLLGAASGVLVVRFFAKVRRDAWTYIGAVLLGMDVLAADFCGWGNAYPDLQRQAIELRNSDPARPNAFWLDFYLPRRANFSADSVRSFGPGGTS